jgi:hypothetical protein
LAIVLVADWEVVLGGADMDCEQEGYEEDKGSHVGFSDI